MSPLVDHFHGDGTGTFSDEARERVYRFIGDSNTIGRSLDVSIDDRLSKISDDYGISWWEVFGKFAAATEILSKLDEGDYEGAMSSAVFWGVEELNKENLLASSVIRGSKLSGIFTLALEGWLDSYSSMINDKSLKYQQKAYFRARDDDFTHSQIQAGSLNSNYNFNQGFFVQYPNETRETILKAPNMAIDYTGIASEDWSAHREKAVSGIMLIFDTAYEANDSLSRIEADLETALKDFSEAK